MRRDHLFWTRGTRYRHLLIDQVPGEGEHKIMEYIRHWKASPQWKPNVRHCMYGLDADLIMLSLTVHEPHTSLLREEVLTKQAKSIKNPDQRSFHLLHISILREYLELEFKMEKLPFQYDFERIIDDFVLMCIFVGNDFLPNLPNLDIQDGALDNIFQYYKEILPLLDDYLVFNSKINLNGLEKLFSKMIHHEKHAYDMISFDLDSTLPRRYQASENELDEDDELYEDEDEEVFGEELDNPNLNARFLRDMKEIGIDVDFSDQDDESWKDIYYRSLKFRRKFREKFKETRLEPTFHQKLRSEYVRGLQWVLLYYQQGCQSWSWFFPFHYAPLASG